MKDRTEYRITKYTAQIAAWIAPLLFALLLTGCGGLFTGEEQEEEGYTRAQAMIIVATERNRYEAVYTDEIWNVVLEDGTSFEQYLLSQIRNFLTDLRTINLLAEKQGISLTSAELSRIQSLARKYYLGLSREDISYMGITEDDVLTMYREYYLADKTVRELAGGVDLEVSDSEAKVITVRVIQISSREAAEAVYRRVSQEGSDFSSIARETSEGETVERQLGRGEGPKALEDAAFSLAPGEISGLVEGDGWFYIVQCVSDYDEEATALRKELISEERKNQVFRQILSRFEAENPTVFAGDYWGEIRFLPGEQSETSDFFSLYREEFGE